AAFALFYAPLHFLTVTRIAVSLDADARRIERVIDLGCGTGAAGSAWALACERPATVAGVDRHPWAVDEANWTYRQLGLRGRPVEANRDTRRIRRAAWVPRERAAARQTLRAARLCGTNDQAWRGGAGDRADCAKHGDLVDGVDAYARCSRRTRGRVAISSDV